MHNKGPYLPALSDAGMTSRTALVLSGVNGNLWLISMGHSKSGGPDLLAESPRTTLRFGLQVSGQTKEIESENKHGRLFS